MTNINITVDIEPRPTPRPRLTPNGNVYNEHWYKPYINKIQYEIQKQSPSYLLSDPLSIDITFSKPCDVLSNRYGDIDNLVKGVLDAMKGIIFRDDRQVVQINARKIFSQENKIFINISIGT